MDLDSFRQGQLPILIANLTQYLNTAVANGDSWEIGIPNDLQKQTDLLLPPLDKAHYDCPIPLPEFIEKGLIQGLVSMLGSNVETWARLSTVAFVAVAKILLATEGCPEKEQGLFYLMNVIENASTTETSQNDTADLRLQEFKAVVGAQLLLPLYFEFVDFSKNPRSGRWAGLLLYHLIQNNDDNVFVMKHFPSLWFKTLGKIIIEANDRLLKVIAGKIIAEILTSLELHWLNSMRCFWPPGMTSYYTAFPEHYLHEDWEWRLFEFISQVEKKQQSIDTTGFSATNITIGDSEIQSRCSLVSLTDFLSVYIPRKDNLPPQWLDVRVCNVNVVDIYSPCTQDDDPTLSEEEKIVDLQISLTDYLGEGYLFMNSLRPCKGPDKIAFTVKDILSDQYADAIERARDIARTSRAKPSLGQPLHDLELSFGAHRSQKDTQEALQKRREEITSMADSPAVDRTIANGNPAGVTGDPLLEAHDSKVGFYGINMRDLTRKPCEVAHPLDTFNDALILHPVTSALPDPFSQPRLAKKSNIDQSKPVNDGNTNALPKRIRHLYETDSELSDLSEPPEELESMFDFSVMATSTQRKSSILIPRFKKPQKISEKITQVKHNPPTSAQKPSIQSTAMKKGSVKPSSETANQASLVVKTEMEALQKTTNGGAVKAGGIGGKLQAENKTGKKTTAPVRKLPTTARQRKKSLATAPANSTHKNKADIYDLPSDDEEPNKTSATGKGAPQKSALVGKGSTNKKPTPKPVSAKIVKNNQTALLGKRLHDKVPTPGGIKKEIARKGAPQAKPEIAKLNIKEQITVEPETSALIMAKLGMQHPPPINRQKIEKATQWQGEIEASPSNLDRPSASRKIPTPQHKISGQVGKPALQKGKSLETKHKSHLSDEPAEKKIDGFVDFTHVRSAQGDVGGNGTIANAIETKEAPVLEISETGKTKKKIAGKAKQEDELVTKGVKKDTGLSETFSKAPVRTRRAAAKVALMKLRQGVRSSREQSEHKEEEVREDAKVCDASEKGPPNPQHDPPPPWAEGITPNENLMILGAISGTGCCSPIVRPQDDTLETSNTPGVSSILKPEKSSKIPRTLDTVPQIAKTTNTALNRGGLNILESATSKNVEVDPIIEGGSIQGPRPPVTHVSAELVNDTGLQTDRRINDDEPQNTDNIGFVGLIKDRQVSPQKPMCDMGTERRKRQQLGNSTLSRETLAKPQMAKKVQNSTLTKLQAALDPKTPDVSLQTVLNRKPQVISWGRKGPLNQGRLNDTSGLPKKHSDGKFSPATVSRIQFNLEDSPSQKVKAKKRGSVGMQRENKYPRIQEHRRTSISTPDCPMRDKENFERVIEQPGPSVVLEAINNQFSDADADAAEPDSYHLPVTFSDLPDAETEIHRGPMSEYGASTNESVTDEKLDPTNMNEAITEEHYLQSQADPYERSPLDFLPSECDNYEWTQTQGPKTPEGRRTDFWNNPGYVGNVDLWSGNSTDAEGWPKRIGPRPPKRRTVKAVLSDDAVPVLIKQCGSRIHPAEMEDPFIDRPAKRPALNNFLQRLSIGASELGFFSDVVCSSPQPIPPAKSKSAHGNRKRTAAEAEAVAHNTITNPPKRVKPNAQTASLNNTSNVKSKAFVQTTTYKPVKSTVKTKPDPDKTLVNSSSPIYYITSSSSGTSKEAVNDSCDDDGSSVAQREASSGNTNGALNVFPKIGKLFHKDMRAQVSSAKSLLETFETSALNKIDNLKRSRELEFEEYTKKLDGPVKKQVKQMYEAAHTGLADAVSRVKSPKGKSKASRTGRENIGSARAQEIEDLWRQRRDRSNNTLRHVEKMY